MIYGVEAYRLDIILDILLNITVSALAIFFFVQRALDEIITVKKIAIAKPRRKLHSISSYWISFHFERVYFYISTHKR
jgi:hypothetical protein